MINNTALLKFMNSTLEHIQNHPQETQSLLGLRYDQLSQLSQKAIELHNQKQTMAELEKVRKVKAGGGQKPKLSLEEQIILTLTYLRHLTTFQLLSIHFGVSETTANDTFNYWFPILAELLPHSLLEQLKKLSKLEIVKEFLTEYELITDSYEQPIERPGDYEEQKKYYSGKPGPTSDKKIFDERQLSYDIY